MIVILRLVEDTVNFSICYFPLLVSVSYFTLVYTEIRYRAEHLKHQVSVLFKVRFGSFYIFFYIISISDMEQNQEKFVPMSLTYPLQCTLHQFEMNNCKCHSQFGTVFKNLSISHIFLIPYLLNVFCCCEWSVPKDQLLHSFFYLGFSLHVRLICLFPLILLKTFLGFSGQAMANHFQLRCPPQKVYLCQLFAEFTNQTHNIQSVPSSRLMSISRSGLFPEGEDVQGCYDREHLPNGGTAQKRMRE